MSVPWNNIVPSGIMQSLKVNSASVGAGTTGPAAAGAWSRSPALTGLIRHQFVLDRDHRSHGRADQVSAARGRRIGRQIYRQREGRAALSGELEDLGELAEARRCA